MIYPGPKRRGSGYREGHFTKSVHESLDSKMLDVGNYWGFGIPSVSITLELKIVTPVLHEIAMFLAPFEGASSYHVLWAWLVILSFLYYAVANQEVTWKIKNE